MNRQILTISLNRHVCFPDIIENFYPGFLPAFGTYLPPQSSSFSSVVISLTVIVSYFLFSRFCLISYRTHATDVQTSLLYREMGLERALGVQTKESS